LDLFLGSSSVSGMFESRAVANPFGNLIPIEQ